MPTHSYSTVLYDITWSDVGNAIDAVAAVDNNNNIDLKAKYDTSGGELDDGTQFNTEAVLTATYNYQLGDGQVALDDFAASLSNLSLLGSKSEVKSTIESRV